MNNNHLGLLVSQRAEKFPDEAAIGFKNAKSGNWETETWAQLEARVQTIAKSLISLGVKEHDRVAVFAPNMREIAEVDLAVQRIRAVSVPMYSTSSASQVEYIVNDAEISLIFVGEQYQYDQTLQFFGTNKFLKKIVVLAETVKADLSDNIISFAQFLALGDGDQFLPEVNDRVKALSDDDLSVLIYTSGTTGEPKGVTLHHSNWNKAIEINGKRLVTLAPGQVSLSFLPLCHVFERAWFYFCLNHRVVVYINQNPKEITKTLPEIHPNYMCAVPRFWEKVYDGVQDKIASFPFPLRAFARRAIKVGGEYNLGYKMVGKEPSALLKLRYAFYKNTIFKVLCNFIGIDKGIFFPCAGSQTSEKVNSFMHSVGINLLVGYGLTESTATVSCYYPSNTNYDLRTVGTILDDIEAKVGENRELLLKGESITKGYYNRPDANKDSFTEDGFFRTGDAVELIDCPDGSKQIVMIERIKELFKTSNGKYIAPQMLEMALEGDPFIEQAAVIADLRKYVTALIVPSYSRLEAYAKEIGLTFGSRAELIKNKQIVDMYTKRVAEAMDGKAEFEKVKYFTLLENGFTLDGGELTPTLKLKRKVINQHYEAEIEAMYQY